MRVEVAIPGQDLARVDQGSRTCRGFVTAPFRFGYSAGGRSPVLRAKRSGDRWLPLSQRTGVTSALESPVETWHKNLVQMPWFESHWGRYCAMLPIARARRAR